MGTLSANSSDYARLRHGLKPRGRIALLLIVSAVLGAGSLAILITLPKNPESVGEFQDLNFALFGLLGAAFLTCITATLALGKVLVGAIDKLEADLAALRSELKDHNEKELA